jgi:hypothetical protein
MRWKFAAFVTLAISAGVVVGDDQDAKARTYLGLWRARELRLAEEGLDKNVADQKAVARVKSKDRREKMAQLREQETALRARVTALKKFKPIVGPLQFEVGYVGTLDRPYLVRGLSNVDVRLAEDETPAAMNSFAKGFDLSNAVPLQPMELPGLIVVTATRTYIDSRRGKVTAFVVEPFDADKQIADLEAKEAADKAGASPK